MTDPWNGMKKGPVLIGGHSRAGKTTLVGIADTACPHYAGLPFELLLNVYPSIWGAFNAGSRRKVLLEYLTAQRAITPDRSRHAAPADNLDEASIQTLASDAARGSGITEGIGVILQSIAEHRGATSWIGADYHAECDYRRLRRAIPGLRLIVVLRDPVASVCASLYWRTFPSRMVDANKEIRFRTAAWRMSACAGHALARKFPNEVAIIDYDRLWKKDESTIAHLSQFLGCDAKALKDAAPKQPWFSRVEGDLFACPDGNYRPLLNKKEIGLIENDTADLACILSEGGQAKLRGMQLAAYAPALSRYLLALRRNPRARIMRSMSRLKRSLKLMTVRQGDGPHLGIVSL